MKSCCFLLFALAEASDERLLIGPLLIARSPAQVCLVLVVVLGGKRTHVLFFN